MIGDCGAEKSLGIFDCHSCKNISALNFDYFDFQSDA